MATCNGSPWQDELSTPSASSTSSASLSTAICAPPQPRFLIPQSMEFIHQRVDGFVRSGGLTLDGLMLMQRPGLGQLFFSVIRGQEDFAVTGEPFNRVSHQCGR